MVIIGPRRRRQFLAAGWLFSQVPIKTVDPQFNPTQLSHYVLALRKVADVKAPLGECFFPFTGVGHNTKVSAEMVQDYGGVGESLRKVRRVGNLWVIAPGLKAQIQGRQLGNAFPEFGVRQHVLSRFGMGIADVVTGIP